MLKVWKTIKLDTRIRSGRVFALVLEQEGFRVDDWARDMLRQLAFGFALSKTDISLGKVAVGDLGFKEKARYDEICNRAMERGYQRCPEEAGPKLRRQYTDQPPGEQLFIAMNECCSGIFNVRHSGSWLWLGAACGSPDTCWDVDTQFLFLLPL